MTATVDLAALRRNARVLQARAGGGTLMAVVKADAYGHGAERVAQTLLGEGIRHFAVARPAEGARLRLTLDVAPTDARILVLGPLLPEQVDTCVEHDLDVTVSSPDVADLVITRASRRTPIRVHVKVDTGMGRIGVMPDEAPGIVERLRHAPGVHVTGLWTHFATADEPGSALAQTQLDRFDAVVDTLGDTVDHVHAANTGALLTFAPSQAQRLMNRPGALVRTGIALYGLTATEDLGASVPLTPVMRLTANVTHLKTVPPGATVSYGARWRADRPTRIATLGVGYGDGYPRLCSGRAAVELHGTRCPIAGTICMDMLMVDLGPPDGTLAKQTRIGDEAVLFGPGGPSTYDVARWAETLPYEICCGISPRVPRRYLDDESPRSRRSPTSPSGLRTPRSHPPTRK